MRLPRVDQVLVRQLSAAVLNRHPRQVPTVRNYGLLLLLLGLLLPGLSVRAVRASLTAQAERVATGVKQAVTKTIKQTAAYTGLSLSPALVRDVSVTPVATVSAASFEAVPLAPDAIVTSFGVNLAAQTASASDADPNTPGIQLPTQLGGTTVEINGKRAGLFFVSPGQVNYVLPSTTAYGTANIVIRSSDGTVSNGTVQVVQVAPGIFTANGNGNGVAAAVALRVRADSSQSFETISQWNAGTTSFVTKAIDLGPLSEVVVLVLYGTGLRNIDSLSSVNVLIGGVQITPQFIGPAPGLVGVEQINALIPRSLIGRGIVNVSVAVTGFNTSRATTIEIAGTASVAPPQVTGFSVTPALAGNEIEITGSGFSTPAASNTVRFGSSEAYVMEATATKLKVIVPYGVETGTVSVRTPQGEGMSASILQIRTSISGSVENTNRQPLSNVTVRLSGTSIFTSTKSDGSFVLPDVPTGSQSVVVDGSLIPTQPPFPQVTLKIITAVGRDTQFARAIALQQSTGSSGTVGGGSSFTGDPQYKLAANLRVTAPQQQQPQPAPPTILIQTGKFSLILPTAISATFPDKSTRGTIYLTPLQDGRTPVDLPRNYYSSSIVQITPFGTTFTPGAKLVLPNSDGLPANTRLTLFRYEPEKGLFDPVEGATATVTADGQYIETGANDIKVSSYYFAASTRATTEVIGRVLCCVTENGTISSSVPIGKGFAEARGQAIPTDGNGSYVLRNVPVTAGENVSVTVTYVRPTGRVDRAQSRGAAVVLSGLTKVEDIYLPSENSNREPVILAPSKLEIPLGQTTDVPISISDPDPNQQISVSLSGASFARLEKVSSGGTIANPNAYILRLAPTQTGDFKLNLSASDGQATTGLNIAVIVNLSNRTPTANEQEVTTDEDLPLAIKLTGSDPDNNALQFVVLRSPFNGTLTGTPPNLTYVPQANFNGSDSFSFKVNDGQIDSLSANVKITVKPVNDPPGLTVASTATVTEGQPLVINLTAADVDQGQTLTITGSNLPSNATLSTTSPTSAQFRWTPSFSQAGNYTLTFKATDNGTPPLNDTKEVRITVVDAPALSVPGLQSVNEGQTLAFDVATPSGQSSNTVTANNLPEGATLTATATGVWQFKWTPGFLQAGNYVVTFRATTTSGAENRDVRITVFDVQHELGKEPNDLTIFGAHSPATLDPLDAGDATGASVATGDVNGDGVADLIIGAPAANNGTQDTGKDAGKVYIFFGKAALGGTLDLAQQKPDVTLIGERNYDLFGNSLAVGDVNGDGKPDLIIGAPLADAGTRRDCGRVYVVFGGFPPTGLDADKAAIISRVASLNITGANADDKLGTRVAVGNIRSKTGAMDIIAGAPGVDVTPENTVITLKDAGAVYLFAGGTALVNEQDLARTPATFTLTGITLDAQFGLALAVGNFNGDDYTDFAVGAPTENTALGRSSGMAYLMLGASNLAGTKTAQQAPFFLSGASEGDNLGTAVALGDINGDGFADLVMGAPGGDGLGNSRPNTGEVVIVFGAAGVPARTMTIYGAGRRDDLNPDALGSTLAMGDFNGDGIADLLAGAPGADNTSDNRDPLGAAYLILGSRSLLPNTYDLASKAADLTLYGAYPGDRLGLGAFAFGNVNGAETADLVLGVSRSSSVNNSRKEAGEVRVLFGVRR